MHYSDIQKKIDNALADERAHHRLANQGVEVAQMMGVTLTPAQIAEIIGFASEYVAHVPIIMKAAEQAATRAGVTRELVPLIQAAVSYWDEPFDVLPDHLGLQGICDDAYFTLCVLQTASARYQGRSGQSLLGQDLTTANREMRGLIGEPFASHLDQLVMQTTGTPAFNPMVNALAANPGFGSYTPMTDHEVDCKLAGMGFFWD